MQTIDKIDYFNYSIYPETGQIINNVTHHEIGKNKKRVVLDIGRKNRKSVLKIRAIYEAVYGEVSSGTILRPKDGNFSNARLDNIEIIGRKLYFKEYDWSSNVKLSEDDVNEMRQLYKSGNFSHRDLSLKYGCSLSTTQKILTGRYYYDNKESD